MGSFERFTTKTHYNSLKRLVLVIGLAVLAVKLVIATIWPGTAGSPLDLLARVAASLADLGTVLLLGMYLLVDRQAPLAAGLASTWRPAWTRWSLPRCTAEPGPISI